MLMVGAYYGRRREQICALRVDDVDLARGTIRFRSEGWEGELYAVPRDVVRRHVDAHDVDSPWIFPAPTDPDRHVDPDTAGKWLARAIRRARKNDPSLPVIPRLGFHGLRVAAATDMHAAGATTREMMDALGWENPEMPMRYVRANDDRGAARLRERAERRAGVSST